eukprot:gene21075-23129_t
MGDKSKRYSQPNIAALHSCRPELDGPTMVYFTPESDPSDKGTSVNQTQEDTRTRGTHDVTGTQRYGVFKNVNDLPVYTFGNGPKLTSRKKRPCTKKKRCVPALSSNEDELEQVRMPFVRAGITLVSENDKDYFYGMSESNEVIQDADSEDNDTTSSSNSNVVYECSCNQTRTTFINGLSKINESKEAFKLQLSSNYAECIHIRVCSKMAVIWDSINEINLPAFINDYSLEHEHRYSVVTALDSFVLEHPYDTPEFVLQMMTRCCALKTSAIKAYARQSVSAMKISWDALSSQKGLFDGCLMKDVWKLNEEEEFVLADSFSSAICCACTSAMNPLCVFEKKKLITKSNVVLVMEDKDLWNIVCGEEEEPVGEGSTEASIQRFGKRARKAFVTIFGSIDSDDERSVAKTGRSL